MSFKCNNCGYPYLSGKEKECPKCRLNITYKCSQCGKDLLEGPPRICPNCKKENELKSAQKKKKILNIVKWIVPVASLLYVPLPDFIPFFPGDDAVVVILGAIASIVLFVWSNSTNKRVEALEDS